MRRRGGFGGPRVRGYRTRAGAVATNVPTGK